MLMYRPSDRIKVQFGGDEGFMAVFAPLSVAQKSQLMAEVGGLDQGNPDALFSFAKKIISVCLKDVQGIKFLDGIEWKPVFDAGVVVEESIMELLSTPVAETLTVVSSMFLRGVPSEGQVIDPRTGKPMEGVVVKKS